MVALPQFCGDRNQFERSDVMTPSPMAPTGKTFKLRGLDIYVEQRGEGEPLLLLHGFLGCGGDWAHALDLAALARRHHLIIPDTRGHGRSTNPDDLFTHRACAADVVALLDALGLSRVRAIGLSSGGNTLLHAAFAARERIQSMVLVSATMYYPDAARAIMRHVGGQEQPAEQWATMRARHVHGDDQIRALWRHASGFADTYDDMNLTPPHLAAITARTLVVHGDRDPMYPVEMAMDMYRALPGGTLWVVPGGGHVPIFGERERAQFADTAVAFLND
jgi:pimeloyl-ACP methyl ester carboxylesterase